MEAALKGAINFIDALVRLHYRRHIHCSSSRGLAYRLALLRALCARWLLCVSFFVLHLRDCFTKVVKTMANRTKTNTTKEEKKMTHEMQNNNHHTNKILYSESEARRRRIQSRGRRSHSRNMSRRKISRRMRRCSGRGPNDEDEDA